MFIITNTIMKKILLLFLVLASFSASAENYDSSNWEQISLTEKLSMKVPHSYVIDKKENILRKGDFRRYDAETKSLMNAVNKDNNHILLIENVNILSNNDISCSYVNKIMDTLCFDLSDAKLIKKKRERFYQLDKDYVKKYYDLDSTKCITYSFYGIKDDFYCFLFTYNNESELNTINKIISTINLKMTIFQKFKAYREYSGWSLFPILLLYLVIGVIFSTKNEGFKKLTSVIITYLVAFLIGFIFFKSFGILYIAIFSLLAFGYLIGPFELDDSFTPC